MASTVIKKLWSRNFWIRDTLTGATELRTSSKVMVVLLPLLIFGLSYGLILAIENLESGGSIIVALALSVIVLMVVLILLVIVISLIEYLRRFE